LDEYPSNGMQKGDIRCAANIVISPNIEKVKDLSGQPREASN
jgi:hypothetical protein